VKRALAGRAAICSPHRQCQNLRGRELARSRRPWEHALLDRVYAQIKSINILRASIGYRYYVEANHLFIKTFVLQAVSDSAIGSSSAQAQEMHC
jgi:hypothetical protein